MCQSLLEDRFKLKTHRETREMPAYRLVIAKNGPKLKPAGNKGIDTAVDGRPYHQRPGRCGTMGAMDGPHIICAGVPIAGLISELMSALSGPVIDATGLTSTYDFVLAYERPDGKTPDDVVPAPPLAEALRADLGLKLEKTKAPVEVLVVDHVEKPGGN